MLPLHHTLYILLIIFLVGWVGFEPTKPKGSRFRVCRLYPLDHQPYFSIYNHGVIVMGLEPTAVGLKDRRSAN